MRLTCWAGSQAKAGAAKESLPECQNWKGVILAFLHSLIKYLQSARSLLGGGRQRGMAVIGGVSSGQDSNPGSTFQL